VTDLLRAYGRRTGLHSGQDDVLLEVLLCDLMHWGAREDAMFWDVAVPASAQVAAECPGSPASQGHWLGSWRPERSARDNPARAERADDITGECARRAPGLPPLIATLAGLRLSAQAAAIDFGSALRGGRRRFDAQMRGEGEVQPDALAQREPVGWADLVLGADLASGEWHALNRAIAELREQRDDSAAIFHPEPDAAQRARIAALFPPGHPGLGRGCHPLDADGSPLP